MSLMKRYSLILTRLFGYSQTLRRMKPRILYLRSKVWAGALAGLPGCSWPCWAECSPGWRRVRSGSGCIGKSWPGCKSWSPRRPTLPWPPCRSHRSSGRSNPSYTWRSAGANTGLQKETTGWALVRRGFVCVFSRLLWADRIDIVQSTQSRSVSPVSPRTVASSLQSSCQLFGVYFTATRLFVVFPSK